MKPKLVDKTCEKHGGYETRYQGQSPMFHNNESRDAECKRVGRGELLYLTKRSNVWMNTAPKVSGAL